MEPINPHKGRLFTRRQTLAIAEEAGLGLVANGGLLFATQKLRPKQTQCRCKPVVNLIASPAVMQRPISISEFLLRSNLRAGSTQPSITNAIPLDLNLTIYTSGFRTQFVPLSNAYVEIWHADARGLYSDEPPGLSIELSTGENGLCGCQMTNAEGQVAFQTIFPGWYSGRTTHIHFRIHYLRDDLRTAIFTSQFFVPDTLADCLYQQEPYRPRPDYERHNVTDKIYRSMLRDGTRVGQIMTLDPQPSHDGSAYVARYAVALVTYPYPSNHGRRRAAE